MKKTTLLLAAALALAGCTGTSDADMETLTFSKTDVISPYFLGGGVQWSAYPHADTDDSEWGFLMTDEKWDELYRRVDYIRPHFIRVMDQANWRYFKGLDMSGKPVLDFENQQTKALFKILDFCQERGITVMIGEWGVPGHCHDKNNPSVFLEGVNDMRWYEMIGEWIDYLINIKEYDCIKYYDIINEPNGSWSCVSGNFDEWATAVRNLHAEFEKRGLADKIGICGPGSVPNANVPEYKDKWPGYKWMDLAHDEVGDILTAYNTHAYYPHFAVRDGKAADYMFFSKDVAIAHNDGKPFFLGEIGLKAVKDGGEFAKEHERRRAADGHASYDSNMYVYEYFYGLDMASAAIQSINAGVDAFAAWDVDDAMHTKNDLGNLDEIKKWGFWNILATELFNNPADENIRPWYWAWSWICRYLPERSEVYRLSSIQTPGCQLLVARTPEDEWTVCAVNTSDDDASFALKSSDMKIRRSMNELVYNEKYENNHPPVMSGNIVKADFGKGFKIDLPAETFKVYTSMQL